MMSPKELAPTEDQGVIFGIVEASANATIDQTSRFTAAVNQAFLSDPGDRSSPSRSPGRTPASPAWCSSPGASASAPSSRSCPRCSRRCATIPGIRTLPGAAAGAAGRRPVPGRVRHRLDRRARADPGVRAPAPAEGRAERHVRLPADHRHQDRPAAVRDRDRPRQGGRARPQPAAGRRRPRRPWWAATSSTASTSTAAATRSSRRSSGSTGSTPTSCANIYVTGPDGQLVPLSTIATLREHDRAALAQPLPAAQRRQDQRRRHPAARRGAALPRGRGRGDPAQGLRRRLHRRVAPAARRGQQVPARPSGWR